MRLENQDLLYLFTNRLSIAGYPFGQIAFAGYTLILPTAIGCCGYDVDGYDSSGYDTGVEGKHVIVQLTEDIHVGH